MQDIIVKRYIVYPNLELLPICFPISPPNQLNSNKRKPSMNNPATK